MTEVDIFHVERLRFKRMKLVLNLSLMRKYPISAMSAIEVYLEVAQVDFMLPLDYHREFPIDGRGGHHPYIAVSICVRFR